jgi:hypothetical protein
LFLWTSLFRDLQSKILVIIFVFVFLCSFILFLSHFLSSLLTHSFVFARRLILFFAFTFFGWTNVPFLWRSIFIIFSTSFLWWLYRTTIVWLFNWTFLCLYQSLLLHFYQFKKAIEDLNSLTFRCGRANFDWKLNSLFFNEFIKVTLVILNWNILFFLRSLLRRLRTNLIEFKCKSAVIIISILNVDISTKYLLLNFFGWWILILKMILFFVRAIKLLAMDIYVT